MLEVVTILTMMFHSLLSRCAPKREAASPQLPLLQASSSSKGMTKRLGERSGGEREREAAIRQQLNQPLPAVTGGRTTNSRSVAGKVAPKWLQSSPPVWKTAIP